VLFRSVVLGPLRSSSASKNMRGEVSPPNLNEGVVITTASGLLICLDTYQECSMVFNQQIHKGKIEHIKYLHQRQELVMIARNSGGASMSAVKVLRLSDMSFTHTIPCDNSSCCLAVTTSMSFVVVGCENGSHQFFKLHEQTVDTSKDKLMWRHTEVTRQDAEHLGAVTGVSFCDAVQSYATSSMDCTIKFWDYKKKCLKTILLDVPSRDILFGWSIGDLLITQRQVLQSIAYKSWKADLLKDGEESNGEDEWDDHNELPNTAPDISKIDSQSTKPQTCMTFLTDHDRDELAEIAFLEAALLANGNLESYWKRHSSLGFRKKKMQVLSAGINYDVRRPKVPIPPRKTKSNYFKRKSQKELESLRAAELASQEESEITRESDFHDELDEENDNDEDDDHDHDDAFEDLVGRRSERTATTVKSLLGTTNKFARKMSKNISIRNTGAQASLTMFQSVNSGQTFRQRNVSINKSEAAALNRHILEKQESQGGEPVELFVKPNGPRGKNVFTRQRNSVLAVNAFIKNK